MFVVTKTLLLVFGIILTDSSAHGVEVPVHEGGLIRHVATVVMSITHLHPQVKVEQQNTRDVCSVLVQINLWYENKLIFIIHNISQQLRGLE